MIRNVDHLMFVYGTLKKGYGNHHIMKPAVFVGDDTISGTMYSFGDYPAIVAGKDIIHGELWKISTEQRKRIDHMEGHPFLFKRLLTHTRSGKFAWVYWFQAAEKLSQEKIPILHSGRWA